MMMGRVIERWLLPERQVEMSGDAVGRCTASGKRASGTVN